MKDSKKQKEWKEMNKIIQDLNMKMETIKKIQTKGLMEMKNLVIWTENPEKSFTNRIQVIEKKTPGIEDTIK